MEDWLRGLRSIMLSSLNYNRLPIPVERGVCSEWARGMGIPESGDAVIYTSCLYQLVPYINSFTSLMEKAPPSALGPLVNRLSHLVASFARVALKPPRSEVDRVNGIVRAIATLLIRNGVKFAYMPDEPYSGALLYELGFEDDFKEYFSSVVLSYFRSRGIKNVITIDPHTHHILTVVAPRFFGDLGLRVVNYMELIKGVDKAKVSRVVIHDSCLYSRYLGMRNAYRVLLEKAGVEHVEDPYVTGVSTSMCCGGPVESINPSLSNKVARLRIDALSKLSNNVVVACPICYANLSRNSGGRVKVLDLAEVLTGAQ